jgi:two-component system NtrC family sensor kinase
MPLQRRDDKDTPRKSLTKGKRVNRRKDSTHSSILEERLRASEQRYRDLFERVRHGLFLSTKEGRFIDCNQAMIDALGYENKKEFLSIDIESDLYVNPEDRKRFQREIEKKGYVKDYEINFKKKNGEKISVLVTCNTLFDKKGEIIGYQGLNIDITGRKHMERELREAQIESSLNCIVATDMKGNILIFNKGAEELLGYKAAEVIGKMNIRNIYPPGVAQEIMGKIRGTDYGGVGRLQSYPMIHKNRWGEKIDGSLSASAIYDDTGKALATVGIFIDLRPRLKMESQLREAQQQLLQSEKLAAMGRLTSQLAHELNNPIYGIMNTLELLKTEIAPKSKRRKILDMSLSETQRLSEMLRNMLSFSKPQEEKRRKIDINKLLENVMLMLEKQLWESNIKIKTNLNRELPLITASSNQLRQVILNIVANAKDAMPKGGKLTLETCAENGYTIVKVKDTGSGIPEEIKDKIFDAFFTTKQNVKGVGLGLSVCYGIIKGHGGDIRVKSKIGTGTTFSIFLPQGSFRKKSK